MKAEFAHREKVRNATRAIHRLGIAAWNRRRERLESASY